MLTECAFEGKASQKRQFLTVRETNTHAFV